MLARTLGLAWLVAACAPDLPGFPNGTPDGLPADTLSPTTDDAAAEAVTLTVTVRGAPAQGVAVYFQNADASLVLGATTDAHGTAWAVLAAGGYVTVILRDDVTGSPRVVTFAATMPRDALHLDVAPRGPIDTTSFAASVMTLPGAAGYQLYTSCGQIAADASGRAAGQLIGCGGAADVLVVANDPLGEILGSFYTAGVPTAGQPVVLNGVYQAAARTRFSYAGVPSGSAAVATDQTITTARGSLFHASTSAPVEAGAASDALDMPAPAGALALTISSALPAPADAGEQRVFDWGPWRSSYDLDFASAMLRGFAAPPAYDAATGSVSWAEHSAGISPDLVRARIHVYRDAIPEGRAWTWAIVGPRGAGPSIALPRLPAGDFDFNPTGSDVVGVEDLLTASVPGGYDRVRAHGFDAVQSFVTGASGRLVVQTLHAPPL